MLTLGSQFDGTPVLGLQTGVKLAQMTKPIIDPANLKIVAYTLSGPLLSEHPSLLMTDDIREISTIGVIVDSSDDFIGLSDVIKIEELSKVNFNIVGKNVIDETKNKLGKVEDYSFDSDSFVIQQLHVKRGILKGFTETSLIMHRSQIVEINDKHIIVRTTAKKIESVVEPARRSYTNPFRSSTPQAENINN